MMLVLRAFSSLSSTLTRRASAPLLALSTISSSAERAGAARAPEMLLTGGSWCPPQSLPLTHPLKLVTPHVSAQGHHPRRHP